MRPIDLTGRIFERLTVLRFVEQRPTTKVYLCRCTCGNTKKVQASNLTSGHVKSCGCLNSELSAARKRTHGMRFTPEHAAYCGARTRCSNPKRRCWPNYGGRGIKFLFTSFEQWFAELGPRPSKKHSVGRINNDGDYAPGNVRWETARQQNSNRRKMKCGKAEAYQSERYKK